MGCAPFQPSSASFSLAPCHVPLSGGVSAFSICSCRCWAGLGMGGRQSNSSDMKCPAPAQPLHAPWQMVAWLVRQTKGGGEQVKVSARVQQGMAAKCQCH